MKIIFWILFSLMLFVLFSGLPLPSSHSSPSVSNQVADEVNDAVSTPEAREDVEEVVEPTPPPPPPVVRSDRTLTSVAPRQQHTPDYAAELEAEILRLSNEERTERSMSALTANNTLAAVAEAHSEDMLKRDYFSHDNPEGCSSSCRATAGGYTWRMIGENIFMLSGWELTPLEAAIMVVNGWLASPGHRENLLKDGYVESGIGVAVRGDTIYATALYGKAR